MKNYFLKSISLVLLVLTIGFTACSEDEPTNPAPTVDFQFVANGHEVTFTSTASNAKTYAWEFGDDETSTEANPVHTYATGGDYSVKCTATGDGGSKSTTKTVNIAMSDSEILVGTWKLDIATEGLLTDITNGNEDPLPIGFLTIYSLGSAYDDTFTFEADGSFNIETNGQAFGGLISAMAVLQLGSLPELIEAAGDGRITLPTDPSTGNPTIELGVCEFNHTPPTGTWILAIADVTVNEGTDDETTYANQKHVTFGEASSYCGLYNYGTPNFMINEISNDAITALFFLNTDTDEPTISTHTVQLNLVRAE